MPRRFVDTLRDLTPDERRAWEQWLLEHWGCMIVAALWSVGQPKHLPFLSESSLRSLIRSLEQRTGRRWTEGGGQSSGR